MTLDEAIKHCKEVAKNLYAEGEDDCTECANEHEQLAEWLEDYKRLLGEKSYAMGYQDGLEDGLNDIRPKGEWIDVVCENGGFYHGTCSVCKVRNDIPAIPFAHFCPNCGADMRGKEE